MAKTTFGALWVDGRGQLGNQVASKNLSGAYFRLWRLTPNPNTSFQQTVRLLFSDITKSWSLLSENDRQTWNEAIVHWKYKNIFAEIKFLTGHLLYNKLNLQAQNAGFPPIVTAPEKIILPAILLKSAVFTGPPSRITLNLNFSDVDVKLILYATPSLPQLAISWKKSIRLIGVLNSNALDPIVIHTLYQTKFSFISSGQNIFFGIKKVMSNGQSAPIQVVKMIT